MSKKQVTTIYIVSVIAIFLLGALWHFLYTWLPSPLTAIMAPVNESPWEHVKLFFFPAIIVYVIQYFLYGKDIDNFIFGSALSLLLMPIIMLVLYYGYQAIGIEESLVIDIFISFLTVAIGSYIAFKITFSEEDYSKYTFPIILLVMLQFLIYIIFTFNPPKLPMFKDGITGEYGLPEKKENYW